MTNSMTKAIRAAAGITDDDDEGRTDPPGTEPDGMTDLIRRGARRGQVTTAPKENTDR